MKFINYLNEKRSDDFDEDTGSELKDVLKKKCLPVIKDISRDAGRLRKLPYSGRKVKIEDYTIRKVRKNRSPKDMPVEIHNFIDDYFDEKYGYKFRSNTIFITGRLRQAQNYGNPYVVLPVGNYEILGSERIGDLYSVLLQSSEEVSDSIGSVAKGEKPDPDFDEMRDEYEDLYGEGKEGDGIFDTFSSNARDKEDAIVEILQDINYDLNLEDESEEIQDIYRDLNQYINKVQRQDNLFEDEVKIAHLKYNNEIGAEQFEKDGKYYIKTGEPDFTSKTGTIVKGKNGKSVFDDPDDSGLAYKYHLIKNAREDNVPIYKDILQDFYGERWADEILGFFQKYKGNYIDLYDIVDNYIEGEPAVSFEDFEEDYMGQHDYVDEDYVYDILNSYQTGYFAEAINSDNEIMLNSKEYIVINRDFEQVIIDGIISGEGRK